MPPGFVNNSLATQIEVAEPVITFALGIPIVTVNVATSATHIPTNVNVFHGPGLGQNITNPGTVGVGDQMGLGASSGVNTAGDFAPVGSAVYILTVSPTTTTPNPYLQDLSNLLGLSLIPGQVVTLVVR